MIDAARWGRHAGNLLLGAADYKLVHHAQNGRSVYSFCMCPGGTVVAATSEPGHVVTNGMSQYSRNERNANAGIVVGIDANDAPQSVDAWQPHLARSWVVHLPRKRPTCGPWARHTHWQPSCCNGLWRSKRLLQEGKTTMPPVSSLATS